MKQLLLVLLAVSLLFTASGCINAIPNDCEEADSASQSVSPEDFCETSSDQPELPKGPAELNDPSLSRTPGETVLPYYGSTMELFVS